MDTTDEERNSIDTSPKYTKPEQKWIDDMHSGDSTKPTKVNFWKLFIANWYYVVTYCLVFGSFGVCVGFLGPTVFDLGCQTNSDLRSMNWVFFVQLILTLIGSISAGCLASRVYNHLLLLIGAVGVSCAMMLIPSCTSFGGLLVVLMLMGWCMGCLDCIANLRMILLFGRNVSPFLQAMHCFYGFGAFVSPMIASSFLLNRDCSPFVDGFTLEPPQESVKIGLNKTIDVPPQPQKVFRYTHMSKLPYAFYILGGLQLAVAAVVLMLVIKERFGSVAIQVPFVDTGETTIVEPSNNDGSLLSRLNCCAFGPKQVLFITIISSVILFIFDGLQSSYANYIYSYAQEADVPIEKYEGAILDACFWGLFSFGRLISVFFAAKFTAAFMLLCNIVGTAFAILITIIFRSNHVAIYLGTCLVGVFVSSMSPSAMSMTEQYIDIKASITTCLVVAACLGEALCPIIVGNLVVSMGSVSFLAFCFTMTLVSLLLYWALFAAGKEMPKFIAGGKRSFVFLRPTPGDGSDENTIIDPSSVKYYTRMPESDSKVELAPLPDKNNKTNGILNDL
ncbi:major facilitator superfamily domain-containing protein 4A [Patella vulgata]|uniref:major facilitator superfamily domain-containing protein 4A n=1 Tax=Patella vulgata TaxID=6465 RepID=UPI0021801477|nr:major facilitator superfamily domain-containing protein 4A [Patella vulgata]